MRLTSSLSRFQRQEKGSLSVEACFIIPLLAWAIVATYIFFDAFRTLNQTQKATYTIADMISREEAAIDDDYVTAMYETFQFLTDSEEESALRITTVEMVVDENTGNEELFLCNSSGRKFDSVEQVEDIEEYIPILSPGEQLVLVESVQRWTPAFWVGLPDFDFKETALARPRFAPKITWDPADDCLDLEGAGT